MTTFEFVWKFANGKRGFLNVHTDPAIGNDPLARADFISRMARTIVPEGARLVNWRVVA